MLRLYREHYPDQKHLLLLTKGVNQVDVAGAELLLSETQERRKMGGDLYMYKLKDSASKVLRNGGYLDYIGEHNIFSSKEEAIEQIFDHLDREICMTCENRIFRECQGVPVASPVDTSRAGVKKRQAKKKKSKSSKKAGVRKKAAKTSAAKS